MWNNCQFLAGFVIFADGELCMNIPEENKIEISKTTAP